MVYRSSMKRSVLAFALALGCAASEPPAAAPPAQPAPLPRVAETSASGPTPPPSAEPTADAPPVGPPKPRPCLKLVIGLASKMNIDGPGWPNLVRATDRAQKDHDLGSASYDSDPGRAAAHFMDCASRFLAPGIEDRELAQSNAQACYMSAVSAWAAAGTFETKGRAAIEKAAKVDKANAEFLRKYLADPPGDCKPSGG